MLRVTAVGDRFAEGASEPDRRSYRERQSGPGAGERDDVGGDDHRQERSGGDESQGIERAEERLRHLDEEREERRVRAVGRPSRAGEVPSEGEPLAPVKPGRVGALLPPAASGDGAEDQGRRQPGGDRRHRVGAPRHSARKEVARLPPALQPALLLHGHDRSVAWGGGRRCGGCRTDTRERGRGTFARMPASTGILSVVAIMVTSMAVRVGRDHRAPAGAQVRVGGGHDADGWKGSVVGPAACRHSASLACGDVRPV